MEVVVTEVNPLFQNFPAGTEEILQYLQLGFVDFGGIFDSGKSKIRKRISTDSNPRSGVLRIQ
jgi:hypothetical protein